MTAARTTVAVAVVALLAASACGPNAQDAEGTTTTSTTDTPTTTSPPPATTEPPPATTEPPPATTEPAPETTNPNVIVPVELEGSVEDVIAQRDDTSNMSSAIEAWLADDPGRAGVLRNPRGITLFVPADTGFTEADRDEVIADFDGFTLFLTAHLRVGALTTDQLGPNVSTADGSSYPIGDGTIGDRAIVEADIEATNGVIHVIDGPLAPLTP
jgi:uncharacterized surface protein with fasciclin (FAS1) repeats